MILVALGANLPGPFGSPLSACNKALELLKNNGCRILRRSPWYRSSPVPASDQPDYINGVAEIETDLDPHALMQRLLDIESRFSRVRTVANAARTLDLDLLAYNHMQMETPGLILPHPRMTQRAFVMQPLADIAPDWIHPALGQRAADIAVSLGSEGLNRLD